MTTEQAEKLAEIQVRAAFKLMPRATITVNDFNFICASLVWSDYHWKVEGERFPSRHFRSWLRFAESLTQLERDE